MSKKRTLKKSIQKPPPIVIVPDKSYVDDGGIVTPTDIILITDPTIYSKIRMTLTDITNRRSDDKSQ